MGYQHIENYKFIRRLMVREYEDTETSLLPDERFQLELTYYDAKQVRSMREAYIKQLQEFERTIWEVWEVVNKMYEESKTRTGRDDWESFSARILGTGEDKRSWFFPLALRR